MLTYRTVYGTRIVWGRAEWYRTIMVSYRVFFVSWRHFFFSFFFALSVLFVRFVSFFFRTFISLPPLPVGPWLSLPLFPVLLWEMLARDWDAGGGG